MTLTPERAAGLLQHYLADYKEELVITRKVLAAIPDSADGFRIEPSARALGDLAYHMAYGETWFLDFIAKGEFYPEEEKRPAELAAPSDIVAWYDRRVAALLPAVEALTGEQAAKVIDFYGIWQYPAVIYLGWLLKHTIHHRGQITAYLRPAGGKVPAIYGGSFDEPIQMGAAN